MSKNEKKQKTEELSVFLKFAKHLDEEITLESVRNMSPPNADIECKTVSNKIKHFELTEVIDPRFSNRENIKERFESIFIERLNSLDSETINRFEKKFKKSYITINYKDDATINKIRGAIPELVSFLLEFQLEWEHEGRP